MRVAVPIVLKPSVRNKLVRYSKATNVSPKLRIRSRIILLASEGKTNQEIAAELGQDQPKVGRWRKRFAEHGLAGIEKDKSRPGRIEAIAQAKESEIVRMTVETKPAGETHWSRSSMAKASGVSESTVGRIWARHGIKPHRVKSFKLSLQLRREEPDPGSGPDAARTPAQERALRDDDARLQTQPQSPHPLHTHECLVAQHGRKVFPRHH